MATSKADRLGQLCDRAKALDAEIKALKAEIAAEGTKVGKRYKAEVIVSAVSSVDWKGLANRLKPSHQMLTAYTSIFKRTQVRVTKIA